MSTSSGVRQLRSSVVVITGASSGAARATALAFAGHGCRLALAARGVEALEDVAAACRARGAEVLVVPTDITDAGSVQGLADQAVGTFGRIDVWVEAAALLAAGPLEDFAPDEVQQLVNTNVAGCIFGAQAALRVFKAQGHGVLIIVSSLLGLLPSAVAPLYGMSKFAMRGLALSLRLAVAHERDIDVCAVLPGPMDTPMFQRAANRTGRRLRAIPSAYAPERAAAVIVSCARRPRRQTTVGAVSNLVLLAHRLAPRPVEWLVANWSARLLTETAPAADSSGAFFTVRRRGAIHGGWRRSRVRRRMGEAFGAWLSGRGA